MELPVSRESYRANSQALLRAVRRSHTILSRTVAEEAQLQSAVAFANAQRSAVEQANCVCDVPATDDAQAPSVLGEIRGFFEQAGTRCRRLESADGRWSPAFAAQLDAAGFQQQPWHLFRLEQYQPPQRNQQLQVIPARAAYGELPEIYGKFAAEELHVSGSELAQVVAAMIDQLDESRWEVFLGRLGGKPVGVAGVLTLGQIGVVMDVYADPAIRGQRVAGTLMAHLIEHCQRALFEHVLVERVEGCYAIGFYEKLGFKRVGSQMRYVPKKVSG